MFCIYVWKKLKVCAVVSNLRCLTVNKGLAVSGLYQKLLGGGTENFHFSVCYCVYSIHEFYVCVISHFRGLNVLWLGTDIKNFHYFSSLFHSCKKMWLWSNVFNISGCFILPYIIKNINFLNTCVVTALQNVAIDPTVTFVFNHRWNYIHSSFSMCPVHKNERYNFSCVFT